MGNYAILPVQRAVCPSGRGLDFDAGIPQNPLHEYGGLFSRIIPQSLLRDRFHAWLGANHVPENIAVHYFLRFLFHTVDVHAIFSKKRAVVSEEIIRTAHSISVGRGRGD